MVQSTSPTDKRPENETLLHVLDAHLAKHPDRELYTFLAVNGREADRLDYKDLLQRAASVAHLLQRKGVQPGDRVLLVFPPDGLEFVAGFFGCLLAGAIAVPASSPDPRNLARDLPTLQHIADDCQARFVLTHKRYKLFTRLFAIRDVVKGLWKKQRWIRHNWPNAAWLDTSSLKLTPLPTAKELLAHALEQTTPETVAFLQYTSGSTSNPRGVTVRHSNVLHNLQLIGRNTCVDEHSVLVGWVPLYHDMGLTGGILNAAYSASRCVFFSPMTFLANPGLWLEALSRYKGTHAAGPNFGYEYMLRAVNENSKYDLSSWRAALQGGEPMRISTVERVSEKLQRFGFKKEVFSNIFGIAETVLFVTGAVAQAPTMLHVDKANLEQKGKIEILPSTQDHHRAKSIALIGCGKPDRELGVDVRVVDPETCEPRDSYEIGELWLSSRSNSNGYWGWDEADNNARFKAKIPGDDSGRTYLRTGDLGFLHDDELFICGRSKDLLIISGRNVHPQDVEQSVEEAHPLIRRGNVACIGIQYNGAEHLVIVTEVKSQKDAPWDEVVNAIREVVSREQRLSCYEVVLIKPRSIPKTTSGKIKRGETRKAWFEGKLRSIHRSTNLPKESPQNNKDSQDSLSFIRDELARLLGLSSPSDIDTEQPFHQLGLGSLMAMELRDALEIQTGLPLPVSVAFNHPTPAALARYIDSIAVSTKPTQKTRLEVAQEAQQSSQAQAQVVPMSSIQEAIWHDHKWLPGSHNTSHAFRILGDFDPDIIGQAGRRLIARHLLLRSSFKDTDEGPKVEIHEEVNWAPVIEPAGMTDDEIKERMRLDIETPFDTERPPLVRVRVFPQQNALTVQMTLQHLVYDGVSLGSLQGEMLNEIKLCLKQPDAPITNPSVDYRTYVEFEQRQLHSPEAEEAWAYWREKLADSRLELPLGARPDPSSPSNYLQDTVSFSLDGSFVKALTALGSSHDATLFHVLLAGYLATLARHLELEDVSLGTTTSQRQRPFADALGPIVNYVVIREMVKEEQSFATLLKSVRQSTIDALNHSICPFKSLVDEIRGGADPSARLGLNANFNVYNFDAMDRSSLLSSLRTGPIDFGPFRIETLPIAGLPVIRPYDLQMGVIQAGGGLKASLRYNTTLLDNEQARTILNLYQQILHDGQQDETLPLSKLAIASSVN